MNRERWLKARSRAPDGQWLIGGSEAAACLGWDDWTSPLQLYHRKLGNSKDQGDSEHQEAGRRLEGVILDWYGDRTRRRIVRPTPLMDDTPFSGEVIHEYPFTLRPRGYPWMSMTIDALAFDDELGWGVVDAKNVKAEKRREWVDGVPPVYACQIAHYTLPLPFQWGGFAVLFGGQRLEVYDVLRRDMEPIFAPMVAAEQDMVHRLETGTPPPAGAEPSEKALLASLAGAGAPGRAVGWVGSRVDAGGDVWSPEEWDTAYVTACDAARDWSGRKAGLEAILLDVAGGASRVALPDGVEYKISRDRAGRLRITRRERR